MPRPFGRLLSTKGTEGGFRYGKLQMSTNPMKKSPDSLLLRQKMSNALPRRTILLTTNSTPKCQQEKHRLNRPVFFQLYSIHLKLQSLTFDYLISFNHFVNHLFPSTILHSYFVQPKHPSVSVLRLRHILIDLVSYSKMPIFGAFGRMQELVGSYQ